MPDTVSDATHPTPPAGFRGAFRSDLAARAVYAEAAGIARLMPAAVAVPADADDVVTLVRWARAAGMPLTPRGSGSSMAGGALGPGIIVDLSRLDHLGDIDEESRSVVAGPGVTCKSVDAAARAVGLRFPVDPSSAAFATVGGMSATNAAGAHTLAFGSMRRWVRALECVFADGSRAWVRRGEPAPMGIPALERFTNDVAADLHRAAAPTHPGVMKDSSGYGIAAWRETGDLVDLLVGSEGTLALFVAVELALDEAPRATASVLAAFDTLEQAIEAATRARAAGAVACELLERTFLEVAGAVAERAGIPKGVEAALMTEVEGSSAADAQRRALTVAKVFDGARFVQLALEPAAEHEMWELRHAASPILSRLDPSLKSMQFIEDGAVPPDNLPAYVRGVRAALERNGVRGVIFGHAGDAHVHVNPLIDVRLPDWRERLARILDEVTTLAASLGGTLSGEHGDGRLRTPLMPRVWSAAALAEFSRVKDAFDPEGILNPGVKVPGGEPAIGDVKYDPALPLLPDAAARALATVERTRGYARNRLDLLAELGA